MLADIEQAKQPTRALVAGPYGPPFHPLLVTIPIGAWVTNLIFDFSSLIVDEPDFLTSGAARLMAIGVVGALAAATMTPRRRNGFPWPSSAGMVF